MPRRARPVPGEGARNGGAAYRAGKFVRRRRIATALALLAIAGVLAGGVAAWIYEQRAQRMLKEAVALMVPVAKNGHMPGEN